MTTTLSVLNFLMEDTAQRLRNILLTNVSDDSKASAVQAGMLRGLPNDVPLTITVKTGDERWRHTANMSSQNVGMEGPFGEVGGGIFWRRRFIVTFDLVFNAGFTQDQARTIANVVQSRAEWALQNQLNDGTWWFTTDMDEFTEQASRVFVYNGYMTEGGSDGKWRWRGETFVEFMTERTGCV